MWEKKHRRRMKVGFLAAASLLSTKGLHFSALAGGPASNVWISAVQVNSEARISVTVPVSYGFVVVGSTDPTEATPISLADGNLLLPNVRVVVTTPSSIWMGPGTVLEGAVYELQVTGGDTVMPIHNYSTDVREEDLGLENPPREGLPVNIKPFLVEELSTNYWRAIETVPSQDLTDFKKYQMILGGHPLSQLVSKVIGGQLKDALEIIGDIPLAAPPDVPSNGFTAGGTANVPSETFLTFEVKIGGVQSQYKQVEQSAKVGTVYWEVIPGQLP